jgi:hypothetical protein
MVTQPNIWLAKILVDLLVAHDLTNIGKKSEGLFGLLPKHALSIFWS